MSAYRSKNERFLLKKGDIILHKRFSIFCLCYFLLARCSNATFSYRFVNVGFGEKFFHLCIKLPSFVFLSSPNSGITIIKNLKRGIVLSSYDVIETFVTSGARNLLPAQIIQSEGEIQFTNYTAMEQEVIVRPAFEDLLLYVKNFENCLGNIQRNFVRVGYNLNEIKRNGLYRYCTQTGVQGYTDFYAFCEERLGVSRTTAKRLISINSHFCKNSHVLPSTYERFGASKLAIMSQFKNGLEGKLTPDVTVAQLNKLVKYYQSSDWKVNRDTTWREDLKAYEEGVQKERLRKSSYLRNKKFETAKEVEDRNKPKRLVSDNYKAVTRFFDQTLENLKALETNKNDRFQPIFDELKGVLSDMQAKVLREQASDMLEGL